MENNVIQKDYLIEYLSFISICETEKPINEINTTLINACTNISLKLQGKAIALSPEQIRERVDKIPFILSADFSKKSPQSTKKHISKTRIILIAAIIALLCVILSVFSIGHYLHPGHIFLNDKFGSVSNAPVGETIPIGDIDFVSSGNSSQYKSTKDFFKHEKHNVLLPGALPEKIEISRILVTPYDSTIIVAFNSVITAYEIKLNKPLSADYEINTTETMQITNITCYIQRLHDINRIQIYFEHNGNSYVLGGPCTNEQQLIEIIEGLVDRNSAKKK